MSKNKITFIIPAAGKSTRFKHTKKKILYKLNNLTIIENIVKKINSFSNKIIIVINKTDHKILKKIFNRNKKIKFVYQDKINGMATAVYLGMLNSRAKNSAVLWADQIGITKKTILQTINKHLQMKNLITMPVIKVENPYTLVKFKKKNLIKKILQSREEKIHQKKGFKDCGFFCVKTHTIIQILAKLIKEKKILTKKTKEYDFLKSFEFISKKEKIYGFESHNYLDGIGINSKNDLKKFEKWQKSQ